MPENIPAQDAQAITLREHLEGRIAALAAHLNDAIRSVEERSHERLGNVRRELDLAQRADREAIGKAEQAQQLRNEAMNEWRQTVTTIIARYVEQRQIDALEETMRAKIEALEKSLLSAGEGYHGKAEAYYKSNADRLKQLEEWKSNMQGRLWSIPVIVGLVVFVVTQLMRVMFP